MAKPSVKITQNVFAIKGAGKGLRQSIIETMVKIHAQGTTLAPKDKAQLANSLMWTIKGEEGGFNSGQVGRNSSELAPLSDRLTVKPDEETGYVGTNSDHWYPEFGTRNQKAQPFLRPAAEIVAGGNAEAIAKKYGTEAMQEEFNKKKIMRKEIV